MDIQFDIFKKNFEKSGFLFRTDDEVSPQTHQDILDSIHSLKPDSDFSTLIANQAPPYSHTGIFNNAVSFIWYNPVSEAFPGTSPKDIGDRTVVGIIPKVNNVIVEGGCPWDADSALRLLGNVPLKLGDKSTGLNNYCNTIPFDNIGGFKYNAPRSNNNNPLKNPLIFPRTRTNQAQCEKQVCNYLVQMGEIKQAYYEKSLEFSNGYNEEFAKYIDDNWNLGVESEILVTPKNNDPFYRKKFDVSDIAAIAFFQDGKIVQNSKKYKEEAKTFLNKIVGTWITNKSNISVDNILILLGKEALLPVVPLDGGSSSTGSIGSEILLYHEQNQVKSPSVSDFYYLGPNEEWLQ